MDVFNEQIVKIKSGAKNISLKILLWLAALFLVFLTFLFIDYLNTIAIIIIGGLFYGAYKLSSRLNVEYEYILTNGELDVDKIVAQSTRRRMVTIKCSDIEKVGKYSAGLKTHGKFLMCCNPSENAFYVLARDTKNEAVCLVMEPNDKMKNGIKGYLPRIIQKGAFED